MLVNLIQLTRFDTYITMRYLKINIVIINRQSEPI